MRIALYLRVSTPNQRQTQTIEQQLDQLQRHLQGRQWTVAQAHIFRDDGFSGASLNRPGLDRLRDCVRNRELDVVLITAPDRLARNYIHQMVLLEEFERGGCQVEFLERPMSQDPHDQLVLQIRSAVAEYERTLITERMRRGRLMKLRAGTLLPWTHPLYGYRVHPDRPRDPSGVTVHPTEAAIVAELFAQYLEQDMSLHRLSRSLILLANLMLIERLDGKRYAHRQKDRCILLARRSKSCHSNPSIFLQSLQPQHASPRRLFRKVARSSGCAMNWGRSTRTICLLLCFLPMGNPPWPPGGWR